MQKDIYPVFDKIMAREEKENYLKQKSKVLWLTGLSGAGKTTIGRELERILFENGFIAQILDGDNIRAGLNSNLKFSPEDRLENIRRIAEVSKLFLNCGVITINSFISPREEMRTLAKEIIGEENFFEVYINTPLEVCEQRDVKGLYKKAREGEIKDFTGVSAPYEEPVKPNLSVETVGLTPRESAMKIYNEILPLIKNG